MTGLLIGYARVSTDEQDLTSQLGAHAGTGTWTAGPVRQVDDIGGDADIHR